MWKIYALRSGVGLGTILFLYVMFGMNVGYQSVFRHAEDIWSSEVVQEKFTQMRVLYLGSQFGKPTVGLWSFLAGTLTTLKMRNIMNRPIPFRHISRQIPTALF